MLRLPIRSAMTMALFGNQEKMLYICSTEKESSRSSFLIIHYSFRTYTTSSPRLHYCNLADALRLLGSYTTVIRLHVLTFLLNCPDVYFNCPVVCG